MKKIFPFLIFAALLGACKSPAVEIVPKPVSIETTRDVVQLSKDLTFNVGSSELADLVTVWGETFAPIAGAGETKTKMRADVLLLIDGDLESEEYSLQIADAPNKVVISGGSTAGVWWGLQTLAQILVQSRSDDGFDAPCVSISDKPYFSYRGGMLDCCRHFFSVDEVKRFIDILSLHKLNTFHWHLTEDQGWRIEIKKYPRLTEVGSIRKETIVGFHHESTEYDGTPYGGFYTQDEIRDIVKYAADRQITIIPEIEMPGHSLGALASYPELGCVGKDYEVSPVWGVFPDIYCAGNPKTLQFLKDVYDEVCELFPSEYIHVGGDEAPITRWEECPKCQAKRAELGLEKTEYLHGYLLRAIEEHLNAKGRKIIGWDEVLDADVTPTATIMSWRGPAGGIRAAKQGNHVVMSPNSYYYLDYYQTADHEANGEPLAIGGYVPLSKTYAFEPFDELDEEQKQYITGVQANLWTEYVATFDHAQQMVLPRYCGLSEVAWGSEKEDFASFRKRVVDVMVPLYEALGLNYAKYGLDE